MYQSGICKSPVTSKWRLMFNTVRMECLIPGTMSWHITYFSVTCVPFNMQKLLLVGDILLHHWTPKIWCAVWASYQIRKIAGCACAGNAGNVFPRRRFQRKPLVSDPGMHHGTCVTHVPWCMSGSLTRGDGENVPGIPGACAPAILRIWQEAHDECGRRMWNLKQRQDIGHVTLLSLDWIHTNLACMLPRYNAYKGGYVEIQSTWNNISGTEEQISLIQ